MSSNSLWSAQDLSGSITISSNNNVSSGLSYAAGKNTLSLNASLGTYFGLLGRQVFPSMANKTTVKVTCRFDTTATESFVGLSDYQDGILFGLKGGQPYVRILEDGTPQGYTFTCTTAPTSGTFLLTINGVQNSIALGPGTVSTIANNAAGTFYNNGPFITTFTGSIAKFLYMPGETFLGSDVINPNGTGLTGTITKTLNGVAPTVTDTLVNMSSVGLSSFSWNKPVNLEFDLLGGRAGYEVYLVTKGIRILLFKAIGHLVKGGLPFFARIKDTSGSGTKSMVVYSVSCFGPEPPKISWSHATYFAGTYNTDTILSGMTFDITGSTGTKWNLGSGRIYTSSSNNNTNRMQLSTAFQPKNIFNPVNSGSTYGQMLGYSSSSSTTAPVLTKKTNDFNVMTFRDVGYPGLEMTYGQWVAITGISLSGISYSMSGCEFIEDL